MCAKNEEGLNIKPLYIVYFYTLDLFPLKALSCVIIVCMCVSLHTVCGYLSVWLSTNVFARLCMRGCMHPKVSIDIFPFKSLFLYFIFSRCWCFVSWEEANAYLCMCKFVCIWVFVWGPAYLLTWKQTAGCPHIFKKSRRVLILILTVIVLLLWSVFVEGVEGGGGMLN